MANFWRRPTGSGGGFLGWTAIRLCDDLAPIGELHTLDDFWRLIVAIEAPPGLLRGVDQPEHHGERSLVREASLQPNRPVPHGGESAFDGVCGSQVVPVLGREVVEGEQRLSIFPQAFGDLVVFDGIGLDEGVERCFGVLPCLGHRDLLQCTLGFRVLALGQLIANVGGGYQF
jgi:hypothetical protein